ncbi:hypothetical protein SAMN02910292_00817 [Lachnospiraceae bacterium XBB2008]|nr:hypothetical protein SAMN02910292_00817 [Lachnospiraceae bacterium XBB2008]
MMIKRLKESIPQWIVILAIFSLFMVEAVMAHLRDGLIVPARAWVIGLICIAGLIGLLVLSGYGAKFRDRIRDGLASADIFAVVLFLIVLVVRIPMLATMQRADGAVYYDKMIVAAESFEFSISHIWETFRIAGHMTLAYVFFAVLGEFLTPGSPVGVNMVWAVMTAAAMVCIYRIIRSLLPEAPRPAALVMSLVIQFVPLFWGTYSYANPDYMYLIFFIYMWYTHRNKEHILTCLWMLCVVLTKETGAVILFGYYLAYMILVFAQGRNVKVRDRFLRVVRDPIFSILLLGAFVMLGYFVRQGALTVWHYHPARYTEDYSWLIDHDTVMEYGQDAASFGIYPKYMICKLIQFFALNFNWIASAGLVTALFARKKAAKTGKSFSNLITGLIPLIGALIAFALFNMLYITWAHARYTIFFAFLLWFIVALYVYDTFSDKTVCLRVISGITAALLAVQTFYYIDPVSDAIFDSFDTGRGNMLYLSMRVHGYADMVIGNYRYTYVDDLMNKMLDDAGYSEDWQIVRWDNEVDQSDIAYCGPLYEYAWDASAGRRVILTERVNERMASGAPELYRLNMLDASDYVTGQDGAEGADTLLIFFWPYNGQDEDECLAPYLKDYSITKQERIYNWGGYLDYYVLDLR